jgi:fibronectin-binding autotransporter adhesin
MALAKQGPGALVLDNAGSNDFTGGVLISSGTLQIGNADINGNLPAGAVVDNGALVFNRADRVMVPNVISGAGSVSQTGGGVLTLSGANSFGGGMTISGGSVRLPASSAPGTGLVTVTNGGTLASGAALANAITLGGGTLAASINSLSAITSSNLTAADSTTSTVLLSDPANLATNCEVIVTGTLNGSGNINVQAGTNNINVDNNPGPGFRLRGTLASGFSGTITLGHNVKAELQSSVAGLFSPGGTGNFVLTCGDAALGNTNTAASATNGFSEFNLRNNSSGNVIFGNDVELAGAGLAIINPLGTAPSGATVTMGDLKIGGGQELGLYLASGNAHVVVFPTVALTGGQAAFSPKTPGFGSATSTGSDLSLGNIRELAPGSGIIMAGLRTLTLTGTNTYTGATWINSGTLALTGSLSNSAAITIASNAVLDVNGRGDKTLTLNNGQTLNGSGILSGSLTANFNATVSPGTDSIGMLTVTNAATLRATARMKLNQTAATNDVLQVGGSLSYGGTLLLTNLSGTLSANDRFKLFSAASYSGAFANLVPAVPRPGLKWDAGALALNGTLKIATAPPPSFAGISISGNNLLLSGTNGQAYQTFWLLATTNLVLPLAEWTVIATNTFDANGNFNFTNALAPASPQRFYLLQLP